jgi:DNA polymerase-1
MNFQNIPRDDKLIKTAFIPKMDALVDFDYSQIEPRLLAHFAAKLGDTQLADVYARGEDIYLTTAGAILDKDPSAVDPHERQLYGKHTFLSLIYGIGPKKIANERNIPYSEARAYYDHFHENLPCIRMISNPPPKSYRPDYVPGAIERVLQRRGYIETPWGRRLAPGKWEDHKMLNKLIQGSAADAMKDALVRLWHWQRDEKPKSHLVLTVHDNVLWDAIKDELDLLGSKVPDLMTAGWNSVGLSETVPMAVEMEASFTTWADAAPYP